MEAAALSVRLVLSVMILLSEAHHRLHAASLRIVPNRAQLFEYETLTFHCEGVFYCEVVHEARGRIPSCNSTNRKTPTGSSCTIANVYGGDSGEYWCEGGGERSGSVNITVTAGPVMLEIPALPVTEGEAVTLGCRNKTPSSGSAQFYKDGAFIRRNSTGNFTIHRVDRFDGGCYKCSIPGAGESAESCLTVGLGRRGVALPTENGHRHLSSSCSASWAVVTVALSALLLVMVLHLGKVCRCRAVDLHPSPPTAGSGRTRDHTGPGEACLPVSSPAEDEPSYYLDDLRDSLQLEDVPSAPSPGASPDAFYSVIGL